MTTEELIDMLEMIAAEIEWEYPLDYQLAIEEAIKRIEELDILKNL